MTRILIVEDQPHNMRLIEQIIEEIDDQLEVVKAWTGAEALGLARGEEFALILMDIALPDMDGIQVTHLLRQDSPNQRTPIVAVTAYAMLREEAIFRQIFDDYLSKPIDEERLEEIIKQLVVK